MLHGITRLVKGAAERFGFFLDRYPPANSLERRLRAVLKGNEINCVLDVGAHCGEFGLKLRRLGYDGDIISFEPVPESFRELCRRCARDPRWHARQVALGATNGSVLINVMGGTNFSSILEPTEYALTQFGDRAGVVRTTIVPMRRVEVILNECAARFDPLSLFLKIDTQGYDFQVLEGAGSRIEAIQLLQIEISVKPLYKGVKGFLESIGYLNQLGFEISGFFPAVEDDRHRVIEFDCLLQRIA
ncbi:MAG: FkbM family methyltransferase [Gemmatimonadetes bacterium]|nr:FkbM family methyltransferase [Gemmatimonadota bacterium]